MRKPILLVEDAALDVELLRIAIRKSKLTTPIEVVGDGEEAIAYLNGTGKYADRDKYPMPEMVFLDLELPGIDGFEVLRRVRNLEHCRGIQVMVFTSLVRSDYVQKAKQLGASCCVLKPGTLKELIELVGETFYSRRENPFPGEPRDTEPR